MILKGCVQWNPLYRGLEASMTHCHRIVVLLMDFLSPLYDHDNTCSSRTVQTVWCLESEFCFYFSYASPFIDLFCDLYSP